MTKKILCEASSLLRKHLRSDPCGVQTRWLSLQKWTSWRSPGQCKEKVSRGCYMTWSLWSRPLRGPWVGPPVFRLRPPHRTQWRQLIAITSIAPPTPTTPPPTQRYVFPRRQYWRTRNNDHKCNIMRRKCERVSEAHMGHCRLSLQQFLYFCSQFTAAFQPPPPCISHTACTLQPASEATKRDLRPSVCVWHIVQPWWNTHSQWSEEYVCANQCAFFFFFTVVQISCTIGVTLPFHRRILSLRFWCSEKHLGSPPLIPFILLEAEKHGAKERKECSGGCNLFDVSSQCSGCIIQLVKGGGESRNRVIFFWRNCELVIFIFIFWLYFLKSALDIWIKNNHL